MAWYSHATKMVSKSVGGVARAAKDAGGALSHATKTTVDWTSHTVSSAASTVSDGTTHAVDVAGDNIAKPFTATYKAGERAADYVGEKTEEAGKGVEQAGQRVFKQTLNTASQLGKGLGSIVGNTFNGLFGSFNLKTAAIVGVTGVVGYKLFDHYLDRQAELTKASIENGAVNKS